MHALQGCKFVKMVESVALGTDSTTGRVDTKGWDYLTVLLNAVTAAAGDVMTTLKLGEGDTTSAFTDIAGAVGGTSFTIPVPNTSAGDIVKFDVDLKARKRYVQLTMVGDATTRVTTVLGILSRGEIAPQTVTEAGVTTWVKV